MGANQQILSSLGGSSAPVIPSTNLYIDYNPQGQAYANNDPIGTLVDTVAARNGTASGAQRPVFKTNQINTSLPAISFDGTNQYFDCVNLSALSAGTVHIVVKLDTDPPIDAHSGLWGMGSDVTGTHFPFSDGNIYDSFGTTVRKTVGNPGPTLTQWRIYSVWSDSNDWAAYLDGASLFTTATNTVGFFSGAFILGAHANAASYKLQGYIARFLFYNAKQSTQDFTDTIAALQGIYGL